MDFQFCVSNEHVLRNHMAIKFQISSFLSLILCRFKITYFWGLFCCYCCWSCPQTNTPMTMGGNIVHIHNQCLNKVQCQMLLVLTWHHMLYQHRTHYRHGPHNVRLTYFQSWGVNYKAATLWEDLWGYLHNHHHYHFQKCQFANFANCMQLEEAVFCQIFYN